ncbi:MAG: PHB depolymerase family esterase [Burkholderiaceae bacterium]|nr:PHB depolymerase family esterase [Burkholderiaceae bacterium]
MARRRAFDVWARMFQRSLTAITGSVLRESGRQVTRAMKPLREMSLPQRPLVKGSGDWIPGVALGPTGARRFRLYRPPDVKFGERLPLMVMLHGCGQTADSFAASTRMNRIASRERFLVLYPEQDRLANAQGCWNWFDTTKLRRAQGEAALILKAIDQVCLLHPVDRGRVALVGLSAGASMASLLATLHPERFKAVVMHSGVPPGKAHSAISALGAMHGRRATVPLKATPQTPSASWPPLLVIHGAADTVVSLENGRAAAQMWSDAGRTAHARPGRTVRRGKRYPMTVTDFKEGRRTVVTLVEVDRLGHAWSGGAGKQPFSDAQGPDASRLAWAFAARQFRAHGAG